MSFAGLITGSAFGETYVVRPDGTGDFPTIQAAIDACTDGDVIELTDGTFTGDGNRDIDYLGKAIRIRSLSGHAGECILDCEFSERAFRFVNQEGPESILQQVTIRNGVASDGGAIYCIDTSPTVLGCVFEDNDAEQGGAIYT
jgi:hypothetical protein